MSSPYMFLALAALAHCVSGCAGPAQAPGRTPPPVEASSETAKEHSGWPLEDYVLSSGEPISVRCGRVWWEQADKSLHARLEEWPNDPALNATWNPAETIRDKQNDAVYMRLGLNDWWRLSEPDPVRDPGEQVEATPTWEEVPAEIKHAIPEHYTAWGVHAVERARLPSGAVVYRFEMSDGTSAHPSLDRWVGVEVSSEGEYLRPFAVPPRKGPLEDQ